MELPLNTEPSTSPEERTDLNQEADEREAFCRQVAKLVRASARPLEALANLVYLAKADPDSAARTVEYMSAAEEEIAQIFGLYSILGMRLDCIPPPPTITIGFEVR